LVQGAVYLILLGILLSLLVFFAELFFGKRYLAAKHVNINKDILMTMVGKTKYCIQRYPELELDVRKINKKKKKRKMKKHNLPFQYIE